MIGHSISAQTSASAIAAAAWREPWATWPISAAATREHDEQEAALLIGNREPEDRDQHDEQADHDVAPGARRRVLGVTGADGAPEIAAQSRLNATANAKQKPMPPPSNNAPSSRTSPTGRW